MQSRTTTIVRPLAVLLLSLAAVVAFAADNDFASGRIRVKLQPELANHMRTAVLPGVEAQAAKGAQLVTGITAFDRISQKVKAVRMRRVFPDAGRFEERHKAFGLDRWYDIEFTDSTMTPAQVRNLYSTVPGVAEAERIAIPKPIGGERFRRISAQDVARAAKSAATMPFNDPLLSNQWHYHNDGSLAGSKAGADINAFEAWASGVTGSKDVVVAIIDGGFQTDHPDLKDNVWVNEAELNGKPGVDDDNDGYVDDIYGYNFLIGSADISAHDHGTHVAGTVGATNGNGVGVCGVAGGQDGTGGVKMMVCQIFDSRASESMAADYAAAIVYAADMGASIAQCSWGFSTAGVEDKTVSEAVKYFTQYGGGDKMNGGLCIFASGNTEDEGDYYPSCQQEVVAVAATTCAGVPAYYSTRGDWVDVSAPGGLQDSGEKWGVLSTLPGDDYGYNEGTSMACPHVSGVAALILSKYGNKNFSNETLRTMLTTSVNDIYTGVDEQYQGKFGSGCIDAYKALQGNEESVPQAVSDLAVVASHDNVRLEWTIPESEEKVIDHHVVYYSTSEITASTVLEQLPSVSVDTKYQYSGDTVSYELTGLKANTTYYFCVVAYNRWGTASERSAVVSATTNSGPKAAVSKTSLTMRLNAATTAVPSATFDIQNTGEGLLKWQLTHATRKVTYSTSDRSAKAPSPGRVVPFAGSLTTDAVEEHTLVSSDYQAEEWPKTLAYYKNLLCYLGESDIDLPNAMAQYFYVDPDSLPDGFNLTALNIAGYYGSNPEIAVYGGSSSISTASLLEKVEYTKFTHGTDVELAEQLYFAPGDGFWVVVKYADGQTNPLTAARATQTGLQTRSYYSSDNGETWTQLSEVVSEGNYAKYADVITWAIKAKSKNPDWSSLLSPTPSSGEVLAGEKQTVKLSTDGQKLVNGSYQFNLHLKTNEAEPADPTVAVALTVTGNKPEIVSKQMVDFGNLIVGQTKTLTVELTNKGFGNFCGSNGMGFYTSTKGITCSSDQFDVSAGAKAIAARSSGTVDVKFAPTAAGDFTGNVTLTDKDGNKHSFVVRGTASDPAKLSLSPASFDLGDLEVGGQTKTGTFTLTNEGKYPLQYVFPKFSSENVEGATAKAHKYGYTYISNIDGSTEFAYEALPELPDETDITSQFDDNSWQSSALSLGFSFPFYGERFDQVYVTSHGGIEMHTKTGHIGTFVPRPANMNGLGYISAFGDSGLPGSLTMVSGSKVVYGHKDGKFYVAFKDVQALGASGMTTISFHMALSADGSAEIFYDDYDHSAMSDDGGLMYIGVCDTECEDPFTLCDVTTYRKGDTFSSKIATGTAIKIVAPTPCLVKSVTSTDGYIGIGESKTISFTAAATDEHDAGETEYRLLMLTNDPTNATAAVTIRANITGDELVANVTADSTQVDFGSVFQNSTQKRFFNLRNAGRAAKQVSSATVGNSVFTLDEASQGAFTVGARQSKDIIITANTTTRGTYETTLDISYADGTSLSIPLKATVIGSPQLLLTPDSIALEAEYGASVDTTFTVSNTGDEPMKLSIAPADWFSFKSTVAQQDGDAVDYVYQSASVDESVKYSWVDITADYDEHMPFEYYYEQTDYKEVELPFAFPFYGKTYTKMYIYDTGFVSFTEPEADYATFPEPPASLPTKDTFYKNIICPYWGNHSMSTDEEDGVYYKAYDDHAVVSFMNYGNSVMIGMNYQVILNSDGTFQFQYQLEPDGMFLTVYGLCGVMNEDGTRGVNPEDLYLTPGNAIRFQPVVSHTVAPGQKSQTAIRVMANKLAGEYDNQISLTTDVPGKESTVLPVHLSIKGEAKAVFPDSVVVSQPVDPNMEPTYVDFEISNEGTRAFTITNIESKLFSYASAIYNVEASLFYEGEDGSDPDDPGPLSLTDGSGTVGDGKWNAYTSGSTAPLEVGLEPLKFRLYYNDVVTLKDKTVPLTFTVTGLDKTTVSVPVRVRITEAPELSFSRDEIVISGVASDYEGTETMTMTNSGKYPLTYSLRLDPSGRDEATDDYDYDDDTASLLPSLIAPEPAKSLIAGFRDAHSLLLKTATTKDEEDEPYVWDLASGGGFSNSIYYPIYRPLSGARATIIGTGSDDLESNFYAATRYVAPAEGFNLTHLFFVGTVGDLTNVDIDATVVLGQNVATKKKNIGHGRLHIDSEEPTNTSGAHNGEARMLEFDKPVYINPGDTFFVVLKYPAGYGYSAIMTSKAGDMVSGRYMCYLNSFGGWIDIEETYDEAYSYGAFGFCMSCIEHTPGQPWITLDTDGTEGTLAVGAKKDVGFNIHAASAYFDKGTRATLVVKSDDPERKVVNYHVTLNKNAAPTFTTPRYTPTVNEGDTTRVTVTVSDEDGDAFTASLTDDTGISFIEQATGDGVTLLKDGTVSAAAGATATLTLTLAPDWGTAGNHTLTLVAADANDNARETTVDYSVNHVNRKPVFNGPTEIDVAVGGTTDAFSFSDFFYDPDQDEMTFTAKMFSDKYAEVFTTQNKFIVSGLALGTTSLTLAATDSVGAKTQKMIVVKVMTATGIDGTTVADGTLSVDATGDVLSVTLSRDVDDAVLTLFDNGGKTVARHEAHHVRAGETLTLQGVALTPGIYHLQAVLDGEKHNTKITRP